MIYVSTHVCMNSYYHPVIYNETLIASEASDHDTGKSGMG